MERVGEHPVPAGPLAVRWVAYELAEQRAGVTTQVRIRLENAGSAPWRSRDRGGVQLGYHWLDPLGNPIVWDGNRTPFPEQVRPGEAVELESTVVAPRPPGQLPPRVRPRGGASLLVRGARIGDARSPRGGEAADRRTPAGSTGARRSRSRRRCCPCCAGRADRRRRRGRRGAPRPGRDSGSGLVAPAARRTRGGVRSGRRGDRGGVARRSPPLRGLGSGRRSQSALSASRSSSRHSSTGAEPETYEGLPAYAGSDALFDGRAVVRLRSRSGRRSD